MLIFTEGGKPKDPEKNPRGKGENENPQTTQLTYHVVPMSRPCSKGVTITASDMREIYIQTKKISFRNNS
jgi:hypothetical protein